MFKLNPSVYGAVFALPSSVVDKYINLASELQLKVVLLLSKNGLEDSSALALSKILHKSESDVAEAIEFWIDEGVLIDDEAAALPQAETKAVKRTDLTKKEEKKVEKIPIVKPTMEQVLTRQEENSDLKFLYEEAERILCRTIGWEGQSTLLMMFDHYGLSAEVLMTLIQYLADIGKTSNNDIVHLGKSWAEKEINTIEKANEYIDRMNKTNAVYEKIKAAVGFEHTRPSTSQAEFIAVWCEKGYSMPLVLKAFDIMIENTKRPSFSYVNKVLLSWEESGYKSTDDVKKGEISKQPNENKKSNKKVSYDLEKAKQKARFGPINIEKRNG